ncbi:sensor histidine kinase [Deinococcus cellulosilyticus]|uniref:sensor histidine kinase n=1 Tax=Deinococcus cellulosilyticus TaxID=401558 RepID=UPI003613538D
MCSDISRQRPAHVFEQGQIDPVVHVGDPDRLRQLLIILMDNAAKYTPVGGTVRVSLQELPHLIEIQVSDTGIGMASGDLNRVFERFYRVDQRNNKHGDPGGTGLGLPIAKWIVEEHGGSIHLESELEKGTTAVVRLPVHVSEIF